MTYQPQPGTVPYRVITWLKMQPKGAEFPSVVIAEELGILPSHIPSSLEVPAKHGAISRRKEGALIYWSLGDGKPMPLPFDLERDEPLQDEPPAPKAKVKKPAEKKPDEVPVFLKTQEAAQAPEPRHRTSGIDIEVIERLRSAALSHGEVADLLEMLGESIAISEEWGVRFVGNYYDCAHLKTVLLAAQFAAYDRGEVAKDGV